ncbi:hypothetical protein [Oricola sp.]|uniref:hypothetical protein n=1 Tax=Oricola sp. TaxID=1979950 RepID=UPI0025F7C6A9|nr:hypothetical protein [Oricola sp.]MCI5078716.1 hypothetical protein [Oricola sp.]
MSLARLVMRIATARALKGATLAGPRVFDSAVDPIDQTIAEQRQPLIVLTTDEHELEVTGRDLGSGSHRCDLVIEVAIAARVEVPASDGQGGQITIAIPHTDEGMELTLDLMEHQVVAALTRDDNEWSRVWMKLVPRIQRRLSRRGASAENGVRFAARQLVLTCDLVDTPPFGAEIEAGTAWAYALCAMEADPELAPIAGMLRAEIAGASVPDWEQAARMLGIPLEVVDQLGVMPTLDLAGDPVVLGDIRLLEEGRTMTIDEPTADGQGL